VQATGRTVVITLDTIEAIRSMYLLLTLTQWMKELPSTLFVLSGRPANEEVHPDALREELRDPHRPLEFAELDLQGFNEAEARRFLAVSALQDALSPGEQRQLIELTAGQPLWLALAVEYLQVFDPPPEMTTPIGEQDHPQEDFQRRLMTLYLSTEFWPEAIKRLAVVRHSVNQQVWQSLMADLELPPQVANWDEAWELLLRRPWIRPRANERYVTLHDALAEELARRLIPLHDRDEGWRHDLWRRAKDIYRELTADAGARINADLDRLTSALRDPDQPEREQLVARVAQIDTAKRELDQLLTAQLHYEILDDFGAGTARFLELFRSAYGHGDALRMELLSHEVERFLTPGAPGEQLQDVLSHAQRQFRQWLREVAPDRHIEIAVQIAGFLVQNEQAAPALKLLEDLPDESVADPGLRYRLAITRGNASMRVAGRVEEAERYFQSALEQAKNFPESHRVLDEAEAHKELGFYYRNIGRWDLADDAYRTARDELARSLGPGSDSARRGEMASIQTNWAYLKALQGNYQDARNLVNSAIEIRKRLDDTRGIAMSLSVSGEVYRYELKFRRAWRDYAEAEAMFEAQRIWPWLGLVYQEQAICLHQASEDGIKLLDDEQAQRAMAEDLIGRAIQICRDQGVRSYPSALNRAGRIFGEQDPDKGLAFLDQAIDEANRIADGWFLSASLIEYFELCYRAWRQNKSEPRYRDAIVRRTQEIEQAIADYEFPDLPARWNLLQGHLAVEDALDSQRFAALEEAFRYYRDGFVTLAKEHVGSHGKAAIGDEFETFERLYNYLPEEARTDWYPKLRASWSQLPPDQSTSLLALLDKLY
jgi:tetratricopeptide (TPR) repeat protein